MKAVPTTQIIFQEATPDVQEAVSRIIARDMAQVLAKFPAEDLGNDELCIRRLADAGFSSVTIFHLNAEARFAAWEILDPANACRGAYDNWRLSTRQVPVSNTMNVRQ